MGGTTCFSAFVKTERTSIEMRIHGIQPRTEFGSEQSPHYGKRYDAGKPLFQPPANAKHPIAGSA
jgi:hypothetical protein